MGRNGQRCIHFMTPIFMAMSDAELGAKRSTPTNARLLPIGLGKKKDPEKK